MLLLLLLLLPPPPPTLPLNLCLALITFRYFKHCPRLQGHAAIPSRGNKVFPFC